MKVVFNKTAFVKFKISNNFIKNINEIHSKKSKVRRKIHTRQWILKISRNKSAKVSRLLPNVFDFQKESY
jgi:hypothetical protein